MYPQTPTIGPLNGRDGWTCLVITIAETRQNFAGPPLNASVSHLVFPRTRIGVGAFNSFFETPPIHPVKMTTGREG